MRSVCFFAAYFTSPEIPYYLTIYLKELKKHFNEVLLLCSQQQLSVASREFLKREQIGLFVETNEGFDFGLWYKAFQKYDLEAVDQIALVNDSCILFSPLDGFMSWSRSTPGDLLGMTCSEAVAPHIQSYFLIINKPAIRFVKDYFSVHGLILPLADVIRVYEVGISTYLISKGLKIESYVDNNGYHGEFSPYYRCVDYHLSRHIPLIKKKIIFSSYRSDELLTLARMGFKLAPEHYIALIKKYNKVLIFDFEKQSTDTGSSMSPLGKIRYQLLSFVIRLLRPLYRKIKHASKDAS